MDDGDLITTIAAIAITGGGVLWRILRAVGAATTAVGAVGANVSKNEGLINGDPCDHSAYETRIKHLEELLERYHNAHDHSE